jgi:putative oxidoreductase
MAPFMKPFSDLFYAVLRIVIGFLFLQHGSQKLFGFPGEVPSEAPDFVLYIAGPIELVGGFLIMIGLMTSWSAFLCSGLMAAAYWMTHGLNAALPIENHGERAAIYCFVFLYVAAKGSGIWSVDSLRSGGA